MDAGAWTRLEAALRQLEHNVQLVLLHRISFANALDRELCGAIVTTDGEESHGLALAALRLTGFRLSEPRAFSTLARALPLFSPDQIVKYILSIAALASHVCRQQPAERAHGSEEATLFRVLYNAGAIEERYERLLGGFCEAHPGLFSSDRLELATDMTPQRVASALGEWRESAIAQLGDSCGRGMPCAQCAAVGARGDGALGCVNCVTTAILGLTAAAEPDDALLAQLRKCLRPSHRAARTLGAAALAQAAPAASRAPLAPTTPRTVGMLQGVGAPVLKQRHALLAGALLDPPLAHAGAAHDGAFAAFSAELAAICARAADTRGAGRAAGAGPRGPERESQPVGAPLADQHGDSLLVPCGAAPNFSPAARAADAPPAGPSAPRGVLAAGAPSSKGARATARGLLIEDLDSSSDEGEGTVEGREGTTTDAREVTTEGLEVTVTAGHDIAMDELEFAPDRLEVTPEGREVTTEGPSVTPEGREVTVMAGHKLAEAPGDGDASPERDDSYASVAVCNSADFAAFDGAADGECGDRDDVPSTETVPSPRSPCSPPESPCSPAAPSDARAPRLALDVPLHAAAVLTQQLLAQPGAALTPRVSMGAEEPGARTPTERAAAAAPPDADADAVWESVRVEGELIRCRVRCEEADGPSGTPVGIARPQPRCGAWPGARFRPRAPAGPPPPLLVSAAYLDECDAAYAAAAAAADARAAERRAHPQPPRLPRAAQSETGRALAAALHRARVAQLQQAAQRRHAAHSQWMQSAPLLPRALRSTLTIATPPVTSVHDPQPAIEPVVVATVAAGRPWSHPDCEYARVRVHLGGVGVRCAHLTPLVLPDHDFAVSVLLSCSAPPQSGAQPQQPQRRYHHAPWQDSAAAATPSAKAAIGATCWVQMYPDSPEADVAEPSLQRISEGGDADADAPDAPAARRAPADSPAKPAAPAHARVHQTALPHAFPHVDADADAAVANADAQAEGSDGATEMAREREPLAAPRRLAAHTAEGSESDSEVEFEVVNVADVIASRAKRPRADEVDGRARAAKAKRADGVASDGVNQRHAGARAGRSGSEQSDLDDGSGTSPTHSRGALLEEPRVDNCEATSPCR
jgi:hypothetical protein